ncbi:MAG TPA: hypothetical protein VMI72_04725 [Roseiarcus sp.]|nr:hypothetical protein [Roseiarcus sp.]
MAWVYLVALSLVLWSACGAVIAMERRPWPIDKTLRIRLVAAPMFAFLVSAAHNLLAPEFAAATRATAVTGLIVALDALIVAPLFEHSYEMFRSVIGTWLPFPAIFLASWAAGILVPA